jgi:AAA family ATP:ADP antiporter
VEGLLGRLAAGLTALIAVTVPLAIAWGALGIWLGRAQQRRVTEDSAPTPAARREEAVAV